MARTRDKKIENILVYSGLRCTFFLLERLLVCWSWSRIPPPSIYRANAGIQKCRPWTSMLLNNILDSPRVSYFDVSFHPDYTTPSCLIPLAFKAFSPCVVVWFFSVVCGGGALVITSSLKLLLSCLLPLVSFFPLAATSENLPARFVLYGPAAEIVN